MVFFSRGKGGGEAVDYGYKGKGMTNHLLIDKHGHPLNITTTSANGDERKQVICLLSDIDIYIRKQNSLKELPIFEADKGYDSKTLRYTLLSLGIYPLIPYRNFRGKSILKSCLEKQRWKVERSISWLQSKYRRIVCRYERKLKYWKGWLEMSLIAYWVFKIADWLM